MGAAIEKNFFYFFKTLLQRVKFSLGIPYQLLSFLVLYLSDFDLEFTSSRLRFSTLIIISDSVFFDSILRLVFTLINFDLFQHCLFYALTLQLFISSACYKQTSMLMRVCFMLVLAILRLSDVFSFVLGVVYRLGLK